MASSQISPRYFHRDNPPPIDTIYSAAELDLTPWYYSIELKPGEITPGQGFLNVGLTRKLLQRANLKGASCLDIGTMEGMIPVLMERQGADDVVAYDRPAALSERIRAVKAAYGAKFEFVSGVRLENLPALLNHRTFDIVTLSGVIYHLFSPLAGLAIARGMLRNGGLMIIETAAAIDDNSCMHWNSRDRFTGEVYFLPSVACLDYMVRFLRMQIVDCSFFITHRVGDLNLARVAITCRALDRVQGAQSDRFLHGTLHTEVDMSDYLNWSRCNQLRSPVPYMAPTERRLSYQLLAFRVMRRLTRILGLRLVSNGIDRAIGSRNQRYWWHPATESIDLVKFCLRSTEQPISKRDTRLMLSDRH